MPTKSKNTLPKYVDVLGTRVKVLRRSEKQDPELKGCWGYFVRERAEIVIDKRCTGEMSHWVLRHELAHAFLHYSDAMFVIMQALASQGVRESGVIEYIEEVVIRAAMVPHAAAVADQARPR